MKYFDKISLGDRFQDDWAAQTHHFYEVVEIEDSLICLKRVYLTENKRNGSTFWTGWSDSLFERKIG